MTDADQEPGAAPTTPETQEPTAPTEPSRNALPGWLLGIGIPMAIIGGVTWVVVWNRNKELVHFQQALGMDATNWSGGVIVGIVILAVGVLLALVGLIGLAVRR